MQTCPLIASPRAGAGDAKGRSDDIAGVAGGAGSFCKIFRSLFSALATNAPALALPPACVWSLQLLQRQPERGEFGGVLIPFCKSFRTGDFARLDSLDKLRGAMLSNPATTAHRAVRHVQEFGGVGLGDVFKRQIFRLIAASCTAVVQVAPQRPQSPQEPRTPRRVPGVWPERRSARSVEPRAPVVGLKGSKLARG